MVDITGYGGAADHHEPAIITGGDNRPGHAIPETKKHGVEL
jgi:hypothetical protein